jgi:hypothetical protein
VSKALAVTEIRKIAYGTAPSNERLAAAIGRAFRHAQTWNDNDMKKRIENAVAVLVEDDDSHMGPPAVGYLRGRAQAKRDEAPNAANKNELTDEAELLERAATILEEC